MNQTPDHRDPLEIVLGEATASYDCMDENFTGKHYISQ